LNVGRPIKRKPCSRATGTALNRDSREFDGIARRSGSDPTKAVARSARVGWGMHNPIVTL
jgi:hypothetical protein